MGQQVIGEKRSEVKTFDDAIEAYRRALEPFVTGDPEPALALFSRRDDVTLANPLSPPGRGPAEVNRLAAQGAAMLRQGSIRGIEEVSRYSTPDLGYVVQIERAQARFPGSETMNPISLRVTMIFRREGDSWKVVHRHADPARARPISSIVES